MTDKITIISGIKPTGRLHIGNYFGAVRQIVELSHSHSSFAFIADLHALTTLHRPAELRENIMNIAIDYLAVGLNLRNTTLFVQSAIPAHAELAWIFNCVTTMPYLMRAHAFKDAEAKNKEISVGVFDYPLLMAADILLYDADSVPVGNDQKQHVEIARDTAQKFNRIFGKIFKLPEPHILKDVGVVPGTDGQKMSKSYNNTIGLFDSDEQVASAIMKIPTDSRSVGDPIDPEACKVFALHKFFSDRTEIEDIRARYENGKIGYKESKELLIRNISRFISPLRDKRREIAADQISVARILEEGNERAREITGAKMETVKRAVGISGK